MATAPAPAAVQQPIPPGFVVVETSYLNNVAANAATAIESAKNQITLLVTIMSVAGGVLGLITGLMIFFGFKEYQEIRRIHGSLSESLATARSKLEEIDSLKNEVVPQMQNSIGEMQEMEAIMIGVNFLSSELQAVINKENTKSPDLFSTAEAALPKGRETFDKAKALLEKRRARPAAAQLNLIQTERVVSYIAASLAFIALRASPDEAVAWARISVATNPLNYQDRDYNLACALSLRFAKSGRPEDKKEALQILEGIWDAKKDSWEDVYKDHDFKALRPDLLNSRHAQPELAKEIDAEEARAAAEAARAAPASGS